MQRQATVAAMLVTLRVKNLALVESARVDFQPGLNVITGETGAGKSILVGALALLLGERADRRMVRAGADAFGAEALFTLPKGSAVPALLDELGVPSMEDDQLIVRRVVKVEGAGQNLVNDTPVTAQALKRLGELLLDLHGPHEHQSLLHPDRQLAILDAFARAEDARDACGERFAAVQALQAERQALEGVGADLEAQLDLLRHRVKEIEAAAPEEGEDERVEAEQAVAGHAQRLLELGGAAVGSLSEGEGSAFDRMAEAQRNLEEMARLLPAAEGWREDLLQVSRRMTEIAATIQSNLEGVDANPERLQWLDQRIATYQRLKRKYGGSVASVLGVLAESQARLRSLEGREERLRELAASEAAAWAAYRQQAATVHDLRAQAARKLAAAVTKELQTLGFPRSAFSVALAEAAPRASGTDASEFGFAPNAGEPSQPLRAIASSGEISRVMLATKAVLSAHDRVPILVFDEVDANLGGEVGLAVGRKLRTLAKRHQVLCITHLPQVAAHGEAHFVVSKREQDGRTLTEVKAVDQASRVDELARMMGGREVTKSVTAHARELLARAAE